MKTYTCYYTTADGQPGYVHIQGKNFNDVYKSAKLYAKSSGVNIVGLMLI